MRRSFLLGSTHDAARSGARNWRGSLAGPRPRGLAATRRISQRCRSRSQGCGPVAEGQQRHGL